MYNPKRFIVYEMTSEGCRFRCRLLGLFINYCFSISDFYLQMIDFLFATLSLTDKSTLRWCDLYQFILYFFFTLDSLSLSGTHVRSVRTGSYAPGSSGAGNRLLYMRSHELEKFFTFSQGQIWRSCMCTYYGHFPGRLQVGSIFAGSFPEPRLVLDPNM